MDRRHFLAMSGTAVGLLAGCIGGDGVTPTQSPTLEGPRSGDELPVDRNERDGYPPTLETRPASRTIDVDSFDTVSRDGESVPLAPIEATYYWWARGEARFADARGSGQYDRSHVFGAVSSPARGTLGTDPVLDWPKSDRIVCYCGCPHHLSSIRAAALIERGYETVYVIDEGFWEWVDRDYPTTGSNGEKEPAAHVIEGRVDARFAGETAWVTHPPTDQVEAAVIDTTGEFVLEVRFAGLEPTATLTLETPVYRKTASLSSLKAGVVTD